MSNDPKNFEEALDRVISECRTLLLQKHHDYGTNNIKIFGAYGVLVRMSDKIQRLRNLIEKSGFNGNINVARVSESMDDTWKDLVNYPLLAILLERGWLDLPDKGIRENSPIGVLVSVSPSDRATVVRTRPDLSQNIKDYSDHDGSGPNYGDPADHD
jgi:hypothetical protein